MELFNGREFDNHAVTFNTWKKCLWIPANAPPHAPSLHLTFFTTLYIHVTSEMPLNNLPGLINWDPNVEVATSIWSWTCCGLRDYVFWREFEIGRPREVCYLQIAINGLVQMILHCYIRMGIGGPYIPRFQVLAHSTFVRLNATTSDSVRHPTYTHENRSRIVSTLRSLWNMHFAGEIGK